MSLKMYSNQISDIALKNTKAVLVGSVIFVGFVYYYRKWRNFKNYFKKRNIKGPKPLPVLGNFLELAKSGFLDFDMEMLEKYGKVVGVFEGTTPILFINDTRILKNVLVKDFNIFTNRRIFEGLLVDPLDSFLINLKDNEWKSVRSIVTPTFSSGKLKEMSKCIKDVTENFMNYLSELTSKDDATLDTKIFGSFTLEVIASCCFGITTNAIKEPDSEFIKHLQAIFNFGNTRSLRIFFMLFFPRISSFLGKRKIISLLPRESLNFLANLSYEVIKMRKEDKIRREDFIQHMIDMQDEQDKLSNTEQNKASNDDLNEAKWSYIKKSLSNNEILSQAVLFLIAGYETTSIALCFLTYNLAMHPDYQEKLINEIDDAIQKSDGEITYDLVNGLPMLEMIIMETLRMYPPAVRIDRVANMDYEFENMKISKGDVVAVSVWAVHHDPDVYPDPYKFKPERFNEENKKTRDSTSFLAFGSGPRNCIAMRFAIMEIKLLITRILTQYRFQRSDKTPIDLKFTSRGSLKSEQPILVKVVKRF